MLEVKDLTKTFGAHAALDAVNLSVAPGEIFSLIGPNGSGKTTLVKLIAGLLASNGGSISVGGIDVTNNPIETKSLIGYIPDEPAVWGGMTGEEFLHFVGALYGMGPGARAKKIAELLPLFRFDGIEKDSFENYSRGNKQKFSILAAFLHEPKLLLVDEPIVGLDPESAIVAKGLFSGFTKKGGAVLLVTHTLSVAEEIASRIGILRSGKRVSMGTFRELRAVSKKGEHAGLEEVYTALLAQT